MGILSRLIHGSRKCITLSGSGNYDTEVVGESHYQPALEQICGGKSHEAIEKRLESELRLDDRNPYDAKAVRVVIHNKTVGYLAKSHARHYRHALESLGNKGTTVICPAIIAGGGDQDDDYIGHFGVRLDLPEAYIEPVSESPSEEDNCTAVSFELEKVDIRILADCEVGDPVNLWTPSSGGDTNRVYVYSNDSEGGEGRIGLVPRKYRRIIIPRMYAKLGFKSYLAEKTKTRCTISCQLPSQAKISDTIQTKRQELIATVTKKYNPRKGFSFKLGLPKNSNLCEGQRLFLVSKTIDEYVTEDGFEIEFTDESGHPVANKYNVEVARCQQILKAHFNGYEMTFEIISIWRPDESTLKFLNSIPANVSVEFHKKAD